MAGTKNAKKDGHTGRAGRPRVAFRGYVNYTPTKEDKESLTLGLADGWNVAEHLESVLLGGYRIGINWDNYNSAYAASLYCQNADSSNAGWTLSARASNPDSALVRVLWLHFHVFREDWSSALERSREADEW